MAIKYPPAYGAILLCDFSGSIPPEINKKRPVIVLSTVSAGICTVVPLSTTAPRSIENWHFLLNMPDPLPRPYDAAAAWVKGDMVNAVSFERLFLPFKGKDKYGKRIYDIKIVNPVDMLKVAQCVFAALFPRR